MRDAGWLVTQSGTKRAVQAGPFLLSPFRPRPSFCSCIVLDKLRETVQIWMLREGEKRMKNERAREKKY